MKYFDAMHNMYPYEGMIPQEEVVYTCSDELWDDFCANPGKYIWVGDELVLNPEWEKIKRQRLDQLTLTPADVERALLKAKGWDFEDLKTFMKAQGYTDLQIKAIGVELRANNFFRGATMGEEPNVIRIVDTIGALLGYTPDDMDYLFENKELPSTEPISDEETLLNSSDEIEG